MSVYIVRLGSPRLEKEGVRIGTVRRPPRGVPKKELAARNFYDVWLPELAPSEPLLKLWRAAEDQNQWQRFAKKFRQEIKQTERQRLIVLLAALSRQTHFSVGCYCAEESRCHRSILRELLADAGAEVAI